MNSNLIKKTLLYKGFMSLFSVTASYLSKDGKTINSKFELLDRRDCSSILLYDEKGDVLLLSQFRPGAINHSPLDPYVIEPISGVIEKDDTPYETAMREAEEETGVDSSKISSVDSLGVFYLSPGGSTERCHLFIGKTDLSLIDTKKIHGLDHESESIELIIGNIDNILKNISKIEINITLYAALLKIKSIL